ncbi:MAG: translation initiation factor IF-6 [Methanocellales archaeon]|nr:translation initiation factor IF-6 [Methanocellales archaeon]MDD3421670.1 translation initiation factor IF-6 [Methanocellales archaeon]MDD4898631.1 translation initiation factor IF-6 [Methanocellales archaeon]MDD5447297.1 translation initiation factor IF-6 [Methanocellales archaeon]
MIRRLSFNGNPVIGVFAANTEDVVILPPDIPDSTFQKVSDALGVEAVRTFIGESSVLGALIAGNSHGFVTSPYALKEEIEVIEKYAPVARLPCKMTSAGNLILVNDSVAVVHPFMDKRTIDVIKNTLQVDVHKGTIAHLKTVGMAAVATNKGVLVHPKASALELEFLEDVFGLPVDIGTVNCGSGLIGSALLANSKGCVIGSQTTGPELGRIEDTLSFG